MATFKDDVQRFKRELRWRLSVSWWHCPYCEHFQNGRGWRGYMSCDHCAARMRNLDRMFGVVVELSKRDAWRQTTGS